MGAIHVNKEQSAAIENVDLRLLLAGAGSGKTRVLTEHVAYLIDERRVSPSEILVITFTRRAAQELRERLFLRLGKRAYGVTASTIHALSLSQLKRLGDCIGLRPKQLTVYSPWETDYLMRHVVKEMGGKKTDLAVLRKAMAVYDQEGKLPPHDTREDELMLYFLDRCRENNAITFGGLVNGLRALASHRPGLLPWKHILVDEAQDNDSSQELTITALGAMLPARICRVGDVSQSIYEFRGARPDLFWQKSLDGYSTLRNNYRSAAAIVEAANRLIEHNSMRMVEGMEPAGQHPDGCGVQLINACDTEELVNLICSDLSTGYANSDIAVLARTHGLLVKATRMLRERGVNAVHVGSKAKQTESEDFCRFHALLKLMVNPYDNFSFLMAYDMCMLDIHAYRAIRTYAASNGTSHFQAWQMLSGNEDLAKSKDYLDKITAPTTLQEALEAALVITEDDASHAYALDWFHENEGASIADYLDWLSTVDIQDELPDELDPEQVTLSTIHAAKGLEWRKVYVFGCNEGSLPSSRAASVLDVEGERRLAYVAWTRARENLVLCVRPKGERDGGSSRFIAESGL